MFHSGHTKGMWRRAESKKAGGVRGSLVCSLTRSLCLCVAIQSCCKGTHLLSLFTNTLMTGSSLEFARETLQNWAKLYDKNMSCKWNSQISLHSYHDPRYRRVDGSEIFLGLLEGIVLISFCGSILMRQLRFFSIFALSFNEIL